MLEQFCMYAASLCESVMPFSTHVSNIFLQFSTLKRASRSLAKTGLHGLMVSSLGHFGLHQATRSNQKQPGAARSSQKQPGADRSSKKQPKAARSSQKQPKAPRSSQKQPEAAGRNQEEPEAARSSQEQPEATRSSQEQLGVARSSQKQPGASRSSQKLFRRLLVPFFCVRCLLWVALGCIMISAFKHFL